MTARVILLSYGTHFKANILIDEAGCARLADFGLLTIISDPANFLFSSSYSQGGTIRWTSPERITPQEFGLKDGRPTKSSDSYSLGMVIYETISGNPPFHEYIDMTVFVKILRGEHPSRGTDFTESRLWRVLEMCWAFQPNDRPSIEDVLGCLDAISRSRPPGANEEMEKGGDNLDESAQGPSGVPSRMSGTTETENPTTTSFDPSLYATGTPFRTVSVVPRSWTTQPLPVSFRLGA